MLDTEQRLARLRDNTAIAGRPGRRWVDDWLHRSYLNFWNRNQYARPVTPAARGNRRSAAGSVTPVEL
jgi:hypothetical protein